MRGTQETLERNVSLTTLGMLINPLVLVTHVYTRLGFMLWSDGLSACHFQLLISSSFFALTLNYSDFNKTLFVVYLETQTRCVFVWKLLLSRHLLYKPVKQTELCLPVALLLGLRWLLWLLLVLHPHTGLAFQLHLFLVYLGSNWCDLHSQVRHLLLLL